MRRGRILLWASLAATLAACAAALVAVSLTGMVAFSKPRHPATWSPSAAGSSRTASCRRPHPLTLNEGLAYTCQQWPLCIAAAAIFDTFGEAGIKCAAAALDMAAAATAWACTLDRGRTGAVHAAASAALAATIAVLCNSTPRGIDVMALCICYAAGRKWARGGRDSLLAAFPAAGFAMAQLHGALWTVALMVPCCLILDGRLDRYGRLKALTAAMSTVAACMLNPYGARLLMLPFLTMGAESLKSVGIGELARWTQAAPAQAACACTLAAALVLFRCRVRRRGGGRVLLEAGDALVLGTLMLALANVRNDLLLFVSMALSLSDIQGRGGGAACAETAGPRLMLHGRASGRRRVPRRDRAGQDRARAVRGGGDRRPRGCRDRRGRGRHLRYRCGERTRARGVPPAPRHAGGALLPRAQRGTDAWAPPGPCWRAIPVPSRAPPPISQSSPRGPTPLSRTGLPN